jgi:hypothetical protein
MHRMVSSRVRGETDGAGDLRIRLCPACVDSDE